MMKDYRKFDKRAVAGLDRDDPNYENKVLIRKALEKARQGADHVGGAVAYLRKIRMLSGDRYGQAYRQQAMHLADAASYDEVPVSEAIKAIELLAKHFEPVSLADTADQPLPPWAKAAGWSYAVDTMYAAVWGPGVFNIDVIKAINNAWIPVTNEEGEGDVSLKVLRHDTGPLALTYHDEQAGVQQETVLAIQIPVGEERAAMAALQRAVKPFRLQAEPLARWRKPEARQGKPRRRQQRRRFPFRGAASAQRVAYRHLQRAAKADLSKADKDKVIDLLAEAKGKEIPDSKVHALAEEIGISAHDLESYIYSIASELAAWQKSMYNPGGKAEEAGIKAEDFPKETIDKGIEVELEHTTDRELAKKIVLDHLVESPDYYDALEEMEAKLEKKAGRPYVEVYEEDQDETWTADQAEFERDNRDDPELLEEVRSMRRGEERWFEGGAAPAFRVRKLAAGPKPTWQTTPDDWMTIFLIIDEPSTAEEIESLVDEGAEFARRHRGLFIFQETGQIDSFAYSFPPHLKREVKRHFDRLGINFEIYD